MALPFLHKVDEINMRTNRIEVKRIGEKSLITAERICVDLELEFNVRVQSVVATDTMDGLHEKRGEFMRRVAD